MMKHKIGDEVVGKFYFANGNDVESAGVIVGVDDTSMSVTHYIIETSDG